MTINEYQKEAMRTVSEIAAVSGGNLLLEGVMGLCGETGEVMDLVKKHIFQGHELDKNKVARELGDVAWYLVTAAQGIGYDLETVLQMNIDKLRARYPDGFEVDKSVNRKPGDE